MLHSKMLPEGKPGSRFLSFYEALSDQILYKGFSLYEEELNLSMVSLEIPVGLKDTIEVYDVTKEEVDLMVSELLWEIAGNYHADTLENYTGTYSEEKVIKEDTLDHLFKGNNKEQIDKLKEETSHLVGTFGLTRGTNWRDFEMSQYIPDFNQIKFSDIPKHKVELYTKDYIIAKDTTKDVDNISLENFCRLFYRVTYDQLNEVILTLFRDPSNLEMIVSTWRTNLPPLRELKPIENLAIGLHSEVPVDYSFQILARSSNGEELNTLDLILNIRDVDVITQLAYYVIKYTCLLKLISSSTSFVPGTVYINIANTRTKLQPNKDDNKEKCYNNRVAININESKNLFDYDKKDVEVTFYSKIPKLEIVKNDKEKNSKENNKKK